MHGVKHDAGKAPMDLLDHKALAKIAEVLDFGKTKYHAHNWRGGLEVSRLCAAALRHITAAVSGEKMDPESGLSHLAHAGCCLMFASHFEGTEWDDRYVPPEV